MNPPVVDAEPAVTVEPAAGGGEPPPLRLLYLVEPASFDAVAADRLRILVRELCRRGHLPTIAVLVAPGSVSRPIDAKDFESAGCSMLELPCPPGRARLALLRSLRRLVRDGFDVVNVVGQRPLDLLARAMIGLRTAPALVYLGGLARAPGRSAGRVLRRRRIARVIVLAGAAGGGAGGGSRLRSRKIRSVGPCVDPACFDPDAVDRARIREAAALPARAPVVGIGPGGGDRLGRFEAMVRHQVPEARFVAVPAPETTGAPDRPADPAGAPATSSATPSADAVATSLAAIDVLVDPGPARTGGVRRLEALAMGVPVVTFEEGGADPLVRHGVTGFLAVAGDTRALAARVVELLRNPERRRGMGRAGREEVRARYSPAALAAVCERIYAELRS